jgi:hypothetical protein
LIRKLEFVRVAVEGKRVKRTSKHLTPALVKSFFVVGKKSRRKENFPIQGKTCVRERSFVANVNCNFMPHYSRNQHRIHEPTNVTYLSSRQDKVTTNS